MSAQRRPKMRPAATDAAREKQLVSLATDLVEKRLLDGTASAQEVTFILKAGSPREELERERLAHENRLTQAKIESIEASRRNDDMYEKAMIAMRSYSGHPEPEDEEFFD